MLFYWDPNWGGLWVAMDDSDLSAVSFATFTDLFAGPQTEDFANSNTVQDFENTTLSYIVLSGSEFELKYYPTVDVGGFL
jgi:hypothetical protein